MERNEKYLTRLAIIACACREAAANQSLLPHAEAMGLAGLNNKSTTDREVYHAILKELTSDDIFRKATPITTVLCGAAEWSEGFLRPGRPFLAQLIEGTDWDGMTPSAPQLIAQLRGYLYTEHRPRERGMGPTGPLWKPETIRHTTWTEAKR